MSEIAMYAKRPIIREAVEYLLGSYEYECESHDDLPRLLKKLKRNPAMIVIINESVDLMQHDWSSITNPIILLRNSGHEAHIAIDAPNVIELDGHNTSEKLANLLTAIMQKDVEYKSKLPAQDYKIKSPNAFWGVIDQQQV